MAQPESERVRCISGVLDALEGAAHALAIRLCARGTFAGCLGGPSGTIDVDGDHRRGHQRRIAHPLGAPRQVALIQRWPTSRGDRTNSPEEPSPLASPIPKHGRGMRGSRTKEWLVDPGERAPYPFAEASRIGATTLHLRASHEVLTDQMRRRASLRDYFPGRPKQVGQDDQALRVQFAATVGGWSGVGPCDVAPWPAPVERSRFAATCVERVAHVGPRRVLFASHLTDGCHDQSPTSSSQTQSLRDTPWVSHRITFPTSRPVLGGAGESYPRARVRAGPGHHQKPGRFAGTRSPTGVTHMRLQHDGAREPASAGRTTRPNANAARRAGATPRRSIIVPCDRGCRVDVNRGASTPLTRIGHRRGALGALVR